MQHKVFRFFFLTAYSCMGGIERFNRALLHSMYLLEQNEKLKLSAEILHDQSIGNNKYIPVTHLTIYKGNKWIFLLNTITSFFKNECWVIGHLNLSLAGYLKKLVNPAGRLIVICHGIEVFQPLKGLKKKLLEKADLILTVSTYTKNELILKQNITPSKIIVFPNTLDPFFNIPLNFDKPSYLKERYNIKEGDKVLLTLTRMSSLEGYKGYDKVLRAIPFLLKLNFNIKYLLCGKADMNEENRIRKLTKELDIESNVILTGYIKEEELKDHYLVSDTFVMPSKGEGFGIVFLEAMACGREVLAGNKDGSTEALQFGNLGTLVDPDDQQDLLKAILNTFSQPRDPILIQQNMLENFSFEQFKKRTASVFLSTNQL